MATSPTQGALETTGTTVWVIKFDVVYYCSDDLLARVNQISDPAILCHNISSANILFFLQSLRPYGLDYPIGIYFISTTPTVTRSEACEILPSSTARVLDEAASVFLLYERNRRQALRDLQKVANVV